jgi:pilus assembly protein CpaB
MKSKKGKGIAMTFFTGGFVVLFVGGVFYYTQNQIKPVTVYEFARDIQANTEIDASDLKAVAIPKSAVTENMVRNPKQIIGKYNNTKVYQGEFVIKDNLVAKDKVDPFESIDLTKLRKITIPASYETTIGGNIKRGDRVDLIYVGQMNKGDKKFTYAKTIMKNVLVYEVNTGDGYKYVDHSQSVKGASPGGQDINADTESGDLSSVTLAVTLDQAEEIASRMKTGEIRIIGRFKDSQDYDSAGYIIGDYEKIFTGAGNAETNK